MIQELSRECSRARLYYELDNMNKLNITDTIIHCFYIRDPYNGRGERRLGRLAFDWISDKHPSIFVKILKFIPQYGRWDDLFYINAAHTQPFIFKTLSIQINKDILGMMCGEPISNCAKWMPSEGKSFARKHPAYFAKILQSLNMTPKQYRAAITSLRQYIGLTEHHLCRQTIKDIDYSKVPKIAMRRNKASFVLKDEWRFNKWLAHPEKQPNQHTVCKDYSDIKKILVFKNQN